MMENPRIHTGAFVAGEAVVRGGVTIEEDCSVWFHATVRGDRAGIFIGKGSNIQDNAVVHVDEGFPVHIGENVTVGHGALIHGCRIGDNTLIGMGAIVLDGARIGRNCILGAGTLVPQNSIIPDNSLVIGCPGKVVRKVTEEEARANLRNAREYVEEGKRYRQERKDPAPCGPGPDGQEQKD